MGVPGPNTKDPKHFFAVDIAINYHKIPILLGVVRVSRQYPARPNVHVGRRLPASPIIYRINCVISIPDLKHWLY